MTALAALNESTWTLERLSDELFYQLAFYDHYYRQANELIHKIPICEPAPPFVIMLSDLSPRIKAELEGCKHKGRYYVLRKAAGRVFENIDYNYFHLSVKSRLIVELC